MDKARIDTHTGGTIFLSKRVTGVVMMTTDADSDWTVTTLNADQLDRMIDVLITMRDKPEPEPKPVPTSADPTLHCFREDNCIHHKSHTGPGCCCCGQPAEVHSGCDCD